jgi:hypothetical protein
LSYRNFFLGEINQQKLDLTNPTKQICQRILRTEGFMEYLISLTETHEDDNIILGLKYFSKISKFFFNFKVNFLAKISLKMKSLMIIYLI